MADEEIRNNDTPQSNEGQQSQNRHVYRKVEIRPAYGEERDGVQNEQRKVIYRRLDKTEEEAKSVLSELSKNFKVLNDQVRVLIRHFRVFRAKISELSSTEKYVLSLRDISSELKNMRKMLQNFMSGSVYAVTELKGFAKTLRGSSLYMREFTKSVLNELKKRINVVTGNFKKFSDVWGDLASDIEFDLNRSIRWFKTALEKGVVDISVKSGRNIGRFNQAVLNLLDELKLQLERTGGSMFERLFGEVFVEDLRRAIQKGFVRNVEDVMSLWQKVVFTRLKSFTETLQLLHGEIEGRVKQMGDKSIDNVIRSLEKQLLKGISKEDFWKGILDVVKDVVVKGMRNLDLHYMMEDLNRLMFGALLGPLAEPVWEVIGGGRFGRVMILRGVFDLFSGIRRYRRSRGIGGEGKELFSGVPYRGDTTVTFTSGELVQERGSELIAEKVVIKVAKEAKVVFEDIRGVPVAAAGGGGGWGILDWLGLSALARSARGLFGRVAGTFGRIAPWFLRRFPFLPKLLPRGVVFGRLVPPVLGVLLSAGLDVYKEGFRGLMFGVREQPWYERGLSGLVKGASLGAIVGSVFPIVGTKLGGILGGIIGAVMHVFGDKIESMLVFPLESLFDRFLFELRGILNFLLDGVRSVWRYGSGFVSSVWEKVVSLFKMSSVVDVEKEGKRREDRVNQVRMQRSRGAVGKEGPITRKEEPPKPLQQKERRRGVGTLGGGIKEGVSLPMLGSFVTAHISSDIGNLFIDSMDRFTREVGNVVGVLAAMSESSVRADVVAPDVGGKSYGMFQLHQGVMKSFLRYLESKSPEIGKEFVGKAVGSREFDKVWKEVSRKYGGEFARLQWRFIYESRYLPLLEKAARLGIDVNRLGAQEFLFSMAVQHGGAGKILSLAQRLASERYSKEIGELSSELQLQILAEARRKYVSGLTHLAPSIRSAVVKRIDREERLALELQRIASQGKEVVEKDVADGVLYQTGEYKPVLSGILRSFIDILQEDVDLRMEEFMRLKGVMVREQQPLQPTQEGAYAMSVPGVVGVKGIEDIPIAVDDLGVLLVQLGLV